MADEYTQPTQQATQQVLDPRRLGRNNSGLEDDDIADVIAILHPATPTAIRIVEQAAETRPQHVLFRNAFDSMGDSMTNIEEQETIIVDTDGQRIGQGSRAGADLALRMTSAPQLRFKHLGFVFGRNSNSADIVFGHDSGKRISNQHFRIYLNKDGILMVEDMSTNGTIVDDALLKCKDMRFNKIRMLTSGSIICIQSSNDEEMIKFVVRVPPRTRHMDRFRENLRNFIAECTPGEDRDNIIQHIAKQYMGPTMKWDGGAHYNILDILGKGAFATVHKLATKMDGRLLAAKELEKRRFMKNGLLDKKIDNEMKIMQSLRHPNIVEFVEYYDHGDYLYIIMEYVRHGDLQGFLNQGGPMQEPLVKTMAQQTLSALNYLHRSKITHRDIKPDNILIADLDPFTVKLSDFGLSKAVPHDETFLKTFCGTLLYCAPEVFPDYGTGTSKGTKRRRGARQYHSYSSSVDIWSFGGVLWYALCGEPPFKGIADATGEAMYNNITATPLDPSPLKRLGVSNECIDLLTRMLQVDPAERPTDRECLAHPWLKEGVVLPTDPTLQSIVEEDESEEAEQQFSQLNLDQEIPESDDEGGGMLSDDELFDLVAPKRIRADPLFPRNQIRDHDSSANPSFRSEQPIGEGESFRVMPSAGRQRLFGEIGHSALQSSGILNSHAKVALSPEEVAVAPVGSAVSGFSHTVAGAENNASSIHAQLDGSLSSPSLLGAESMVREMNMESPHSPVSQAQSPFMPATPRTPDVIQHSSLEHGSKNQSQISEVTPKARPVTNRQISLPLTASYYYDPADASTHNLEYASRKSGFDFLAAKRNAEVGAWAYEDTARASDTSGNSELSDKAAAVPSPAADVPCLPAELDIRPPPKRLGKLIATADSFCPGLTLNIDCSKTSWGRLENNTLVYENSRDTRIPKTAFVIFWYSSASRTQATVDELSQQGKDWTSLDELKVGIWTLATHGISINGKHLRQKDDKGRVVFGHLHTGDIVQVYHDSRGTEWLRFQCEFYLGSGKNPRPAGESFSIIQGNKL
ncbi:kinase-like domain-containing protein [Ampelomyces quisqualis]|uniref:Kinase-like domain-containing protein n=1 Tax=Ampelomyces quisqualis TaxID=50730 RepID=A0A6A5QCK2_AMPQU|nr:kinase-like domain-containing protein [Ampelomyces quisqualis]